MWTDFAEHSVRVGLLTALQENDGRHLILELRLIGLGTSEPVLESAPLSLRRCVDVHHLMPFVCLVEYAIDAHDFLAIGAEGLDLLLGMDPAF